MCEMAIAEAPPEKKISKNQWLNQIIKKNLDELCTKQAENSPNSKQTGPVAGNKISKNQLLNQIMQEKLQSKKNQA